MPLIFAMSFPLLHRILNGVVFYSVPAMWHCSLDDSQGVAVASIHGTIFNLCSGVLVLFQGFDLILVIAM